MKKDCDSSKLFSPSNDYYFIYLFFNKYIHLYHTGKSKGEKVFITFIKPLAG